MNPKTDLPTYTSIRRSAEQPRRRTDRGWRTLPHAERQLNDDHIILDGLLTGDELALARLYDRYVHLVHSLAIRIVHDADEAEDVVEDTFWQAWRTAARFDARRGSLSGWLMMIARSRALDRIRVRARSPVLVSSAAVASAAAKQSVDAPSSPSPFDEAVSRERRETVARCLDSLPNEQREVIQLAFYGGLSQSEIAARTGEPLGTIKTRVRLAMNKLRDHLAFLHQDED
jgi:RNA polymerase sigma-70 factor (ECF subfamily)